MNPSRGEPQLTPLTKSQLQGIIAQHCAANFPFRGLKYKLSTDITIFLPLVFLATTIRHENQISEF